MLLVITVTYLHAKFDVSNNYSYGIKANLKRKYKFFLFGGNFQKKNPALSLVPCSRHNGNFCAKFQLPRTKDSGWALMSQSVNRDFSFYIY